ncbi:MAG: hypothetical protein FJ012_03375 [Chloroflexi bacterium]|nr:hypothetical protein [Chloroflexota bacterium]
MRLIEKLKKLGRTSYPEGPAMKKWITVSFWLLSAAWMWAIFQLSVLENQEVPSGGTLMPDYVNHGLAYLLLALLLFIALRRTVRCSFYTAFGAIVGCCLLFGLGMEFAQKHLTETRHFSLWDWMADGAGPTGLFLCLRGLQKAGRSGE